MKYEINLPIALLEAAYIALDKMETECSQMISKFDHVIICDGHIFGASKAVMFYSPLEIPNDLAINIPVKNVQYFLEKISQFNLSPSFECTVIYDTDTQVGSLEVKNHYGAYEVFRTTNNIKLDWKRVLSHINTNNPINKNFSQFSSAVLQKIESIGELFGGICYPLINSTGRHEAAFIDFKYNEYDNLKPNIIAMPIKFEPLIGRYAIGLMDEPDNADFDHVLPALSADLAFRALKRLRADQMFALEKLDFDIRMLRLEIAESIQIIQSDLSPNEHAESIVINEAWFAEPLRKYKNASEAISYLEYMNTATVEADCVECIKDDVKIIAHSITEINNFFGGVV